MVSLTGSVEPASFSTLEDMAGEEGTDGGVREIEGKGGNPPKGCLCGGAQKSRERDDGSNVVVGGEKGVNGVESQPCSLYSNPLVRQIKRPK